jgi:hypothetical protein
MGASGWNYFTPYRADVGRALEELRQRVFASRDYGDGATQWALDNPAELFASMPPEQRAVMEKHLEQLRASVKEQSEAASIEELLEQCAEGGTHSILDICAGISQGPDFATAFPMPEDVMLDLYGTTTPTHEQVEEKIQERGEDLERWQCWYVIVYKNGQPDEVYFEGCSGD